MSSTLRSCALVLALAASVKTAGANHVNVTACLFTHCPKIAAECYAGDGANGFRCAKAMDCTAACSFFHVSSPLPRAQSSPVPALNPQFAPAGEE